MPCSSSKRTIAWLSLGSNLGDRYSFLKQAVAELSLEAGQILAISQFIETLPVGFDSPHPFLNAAVQIATPLSCEHLLEVIQALEKKMGRVLRSSRHQPHQDRTIDIDILLYGHAIIHSERLIVPHPEMHKRDFVLIPLASIAPSLIHNSRNLSTLDLLHALDRSPIE